MKRLLASALILLGLSFPVQAGQMSLLGAGKAAGGGGGGGYVGPGDLVPGASAWWGLRAYTGTYATALGNIADIVDTATGGFTCTMVAKANGDADLSSASCGGVSVTTFCTTTHPAGCSIARMYDQTSNANHIDNSVLATSPTLLLGSVTGLASNRPSMHFVGASSQVLTSALAPTIPQPLTLGAVAYRSGTAQGALVATDVANDVELRVDAANTVLIYAGGTPATQTQTDNAWHSFGGVFTTSGAASFVNVDGSSGTGASVGSTGIVTAHLRMGVQGFGTFFNGNMTEGGVWPSALNGTQLSALYNGANGAKSYWGF